MKPTSFVVAIPGADLDDLEYRLSRTRWPLDSGNDDWRYGTNLGYLKQLTEYWLNEYDWREQEAAMNTFRHYKVSFDGIPIHFIHERGKGPAPMPLILTHGWPSTFWDLRKLIRPLADPGSFGGDPADAFDVIVPSLPGFAFSTPLTVCGVDADKTADLWVRLMREALGYERFGAQGVDWGDVVTQRLGHKYPQWLHGIHLSRYYSPFSAGAAGVGPPQPTREDYGPEETGWYERHQEGMRRASHIGVQSAYPQSLAYAMNDSPAGMAAWMLQRRRRFGGPAGDLENVFSPDEQITNVMLYWLTGSFVTSVRFYYEYAHQARERAHDRRPIIETPTAIAAPPLDAVAMPRSWAERDTNLQRYTVLSRGGHYAISEVPLEYVADLRAFFRPLR
jgi:pimeloyl-ACP methyl ester carboxylesterase